MSSPALYCICLPPARIYFALNVEDYKIHLKSIYYIFVKYTLFLFKYTIFLLNFYSKFSCKVFTQFHVTIVLSLDAINNSHCI